jgi:hypothetical protein
LQPPLDQQQSGSDTDAPGFAEQSVSPAPAGGEASDPIVAEVLTVGALLDGRYRYRLACFQRAYAWKPENAVRLVCDLRSAMQREASRRFFPLGRLMLAKAVGSPDVEIVDGHQRLVTLTILFAVLRDLESDPGRGERLHRLVAVDQWPSRGEAQDLLTIQELPGRLFASIVQRRGSTEFDPDVPREALSESERNIVDNRDGIRSELLAPGMTDEIRRALADYILSSCRLVTITVDNADLAWDMLNTEQNTRLAFSHADEAKSLILSAMPAEAHITAAGLWESCESMLTPEDMFRLLSHIRAMSWRGKSQSARPVEMEIVERFGVANHGLAFMAEHLVPHANRLKDVRRGHVGRDDGERMSIARSVDFMTWIEPHSWVPALLLWLKVHGPNAAHTVDFTRRLECLVWLSKIAGVDPGVQETRLLRLLDEIEAGTLPKAISKLQIDATLRAHAITNLRSANFAGKHYAGCLLRRISATMGSDPGPILRDEVTIEHILPRNPHGCKAWLTLFRTPDGCKAHHQKLGNVVLLSGRDNQKAGTLSWEEKREILRASPFLLAQDAAKETDWTAQTIARRTESLINLLLVSFDLQPLAKGE